MSSLPINWGAVNTGDEQGLERRGARLKCCSVARQIVCWLASRAENITRKACLSEYC